MSNSFIKPSRLVALAILTTVFSSYAMKKDRGIEEYRKTSLYTRAGLTDNKGNIYRLEIYRDLREMETRHLLVRRPSKTLPPKYSSLSVMTFPNTEHCILIPKEIYRYLKQAIIQNSLSSTTFSWKGIKSLAFKDVKIKTVRNTKN